ncbi:MAG: hypothetical protein CBC35_08850 [Planctomycetes bacterium TMED75]|nr:hypothetical protein [Planctomycetaceae bacterium]OUU91784.1 MAG: hypothetical protein CBC35_08850 [Planctomycetes bacterium TMED75]
MNGGGAFRRALGVGVLALFLLSGCSSERSHRMLDPEASEATQRAAGYTLLVTLLADESRVDGILMLKSVPQPTAELITRIAEESRSGYQQLTEALALPPAVSLENDGLPQIEAGARARIRQWTTMELLTEQGATLERALLVSQVQAVDTIRALAASLLDQESVSSRAVLLEQLRSRFDPLRTELWDQLEAVVD